MDKQQKQIYLRSIFLDNYKCFKGSNIFSFVQEEGRDKFKICQWTVFLGNNGTGKTNLLKVIANMEPELVETSVDNGDENENTKSQDHQKIDEMVVDFQFSHGGKTLSDPANENKHTLKYRPHVYERFIGKGYSINAIFVYSNSGDKLIKKVAHPLTRKIERVGTKLFSSLTSIGYTNASNSIDSTADLADFKIYAYGVNRIASKQGLSSRMPSNAATLFQDDVRLLNFEDWLLQLELASNNNNPKRVGAKNIIKRLTNLFRSSELFPNIESFSLETDDNFNNRILFTTKDGKFHFEDLGYGYQCMLAWVFDFCKRMYDRYPNSENPLAEPAVVLIDEIDLHLHPKWQRGLIRALSDTFPNTQFIVSTHSPIIIQSLSDVNLYILNHQDDGSVKAERIVGRNWEGYQMEEILQETMDVEGGDTSEELKEKLDHFNKAFEENNLQKATNLYQEIVRSIDPNGSLMQRLTSQLRYLKNYNEED